MKKLVVLILLLQPAFFLAAAAPNPADFTVKVKVVFSRAVTTSGQQQIEAVIDGQRVELVGYSLGMLALGDYLARISTKISGPRHPNDYDIYKGYDFLMSDGKVRTYQVSAMGQSEFPAAPPPPPPAPVDASPTPAPPPVDTTPPPPPPLPPTLP